MGMTFTVVEEEAPSTTKCGSRLIELNMKMHDNWYHLQGEERKGEFASYVPSEYLKKILADGKKARDELASCHPSDTHLSGIDSLMGNIRRKLMGTSAQQGFYELDPDTATELITEDINQLVNIIHLAGQGLIKVTGSYCGCLLPEDTRQINPGVLSYCQGTLARPPESEVEKARVVPPGDFVDHRPGESQDHAARLNIVSDVDGYNVNLDYVDSGFRNYSERCYRVGEILEGIGMDCPDKGGQFMHCEGKLNEEQIREVAITISQLKKIELLEEECMEMALEMIGGQTAELKEIPDKEEIWNFGWQEPFNSSIIQDCDRREMLERAQYREQEEEEERTQAKDDELKGEVDEASSWLNDIEANIEHSNCTSRMFWMMGRAFSRGLAIRSLLRQYHDLGLESYSDASKTVNRINRVAGDLLEACDPNTLIRELEQEYSGTMLANIVYSMDKVRGIPDRPLELWD